MTTTRERLQEAQTLLKEREYDKARRMLKPIRHDPTAKKWLERLDRIAPQPNKLRRALITLVLVALIAGAAIVAKVNYDHQGGRQQMCALLASQGHPCK